MQLANELLAVESMTAGRFMDIQRKYDRDNFTYEAAEALVEYYDELADSLGEPVQFDYIALCCDWTEYESIEELRLDHSMWHTIAYDTTTVPGIRIPIAEPFKRYTPSYIRTEELRNHESWIQEYTTVLELSGGGYLVLAF